MCVKYFIAAPQAASVLIDSEFMPQELMLVLTTKLVVSDTEYVEDGIPEGEIVVRIPRYRLDGNFNLQMAMSSFASVAISGTALAYHTPENPFDEYYGEVIEYHKNSTFLTNLVSFSFDAESGKTVGVYKDGHTAFLPYGATFIENFYTNSGELAFFGAQETTGSPIYYVGVTPTPLQISNGVVSGLGNTEETNIVVPFGVTGIMPGVIPPTGYTTFERILLPDSFEVWENYPFGMSGISWLYYNPSEVDFYTSESLSSFLANNANGITDRFLGAYTSLSGSFSVPATVTSIAGYAFAG